MSVRKIAAVSAAFGAGVAAGITIQRLPQTEDAKRRLRWAMQDAQDTVADMGDAAADIFNHLKNKAVDLTVRLADEASYAARFTRNWLLGRHRDHASVPPLP